MHFHFSAERPGNRTCDLDEGNTGFEHMPYEQTVSHADNDTQESICFELEHQIKLLRL